MNIELEWHKPVSLHDGRNQSLILTCDLNLIPEAPGVYVFARVHGESRSPQYIGRSANLRQRIKQHLENDVKLMQQIDSAKNGKRILMMATMVFKKGQRKDTVLDIVEKTLIEHAFSEGCELLNKKGTKTPVHHMNSTGKKVDHFPFPRNMARKAR